MILRFFFLVIFLVTPVLADTNKSKFFLTKEQTKNIFEMKYPEWQETVNQSIISGKSLKVANDNPSINFTPMYLDTSDKFIMITPIYLSEDKPILITLEISYKFNNINEKEFKTVLKIAKAELSNGYLIQGSLLNKDVKFPVMMFDIKKN